MLNNLHKQSQVLNLQPRDYQVLESENEQYLKSCKFLLKEWNTGLQEFITEAVKEKDGEDGVKNVGKLNPKKHLEDTYENINIDNLNQNLVSLIHKTIY